MNPKSFLSTNFRSTNMAAAKVFATNLSISILNLLTFILLARNMLVKDYGLYTYALSVIGILGVIASFGVPALTTRETAFFLHKSLLHEAKKLLFYGIIVVTISSSLISIVLFAYSSLVEKHDTSLILPLVLLLYAQQVVAIFSGFLDGASLAFKSSMIKLIGASSFILMIFLLLLFGLDVSPILVISAQLLSTTMTVIMLLMKIRNIFFGDLKTSILEIRWRSWFKESLPLMGVGIAYAINTQIDIFLLGTLKGNSYAGIYQVATKSAAILVLALGSLATVYQPIISKSYFSGQQIDVIKSVKSLSRIGFIVALIGATLMISWKEFIISHVFGKHYIEAANVMAVLIFARLVNASVGGIGPYLSMTQKARLLFLAVGSESILNIALNLILIPPFACEGAALSTGSSMIIINLVLAIYVYKKYNVNSFII